MLGGELVFYRGERGKFQVEARLVSDSVWLTMAQMADLYGVNVPAVSKHIKNI